MDGAEQIALVTGASRGIGRGIALSLAQQGFDIAVNYRSDAAAAQSVVDEITALGRRACAVQADVTDPAMVTALHTTVTEQLGPLTALVNNVGEFFFKPLGLMDYAEWRAVLDSNLTSVYLLCHAALPGMRQRRHGRIVNIGLGPTHLVRGAPNISAYAIAKTGVQILTRSLAVEEAPHGITVNCVSPGLIDNGFLPPAQASWMQKRVPMGRMGRPDEIGDAVAFLVSERASYISGANLAVAGAWDWEDRPTDHDGDVHTLFLDSSDV